MRLVLRAGEQGAENAFEEVRAPFMFLQLLVFVGTAGYMLIEGWGVLDALYMSVITLTTVGFGEVHPLSDAGRLFTVVYLLVGLGLAGRGVTLFARYISEGRLAADMAARRARREVEGMRNHYIVVGYGRLGREIVADLQHHEAKVIVVDLEEPVHIPEGVVCIVGDATHDETLVQAGLHHAAGLAVATPSDAINVFVTLSARQLAPKLFIHTRVEDEGSSVKARRAGADGVLMPYLLGGTRMAQALVRPSSSAFVEHLTQRAFDDLAIDDVTLPEDTEFEGELQDLELRTDHGVIVVAVQHAAKEGLVTPSGRTHVGPGDTLVVVGEPGCVRAFAELAG